MTAENDNQKILAPGTILNQRYQILEEIGRGGFGVIYKALQFSMDRSVAIKVLSKVYCADPEIFKRFIRESRVLAQLNHPNIVSIFDFGRTPDNQLYIVMEFIQGVPLSKFIKTESPSVKVKLEVLVQICEALFAAHKIGFVHRDLKPSNLMIEKKGGVGIWAKLLDFGIAKIMDNWGKTQLTEPGMVMGTAEYMSPEQIRGRPDIDFRSDIYSLGIMIYEIFTGRPPFRGKSLLDIARQHLKDNPVPLSQLISPGDLSPGLCSIFAMCLAKDANERPQSVEDLKVAIKMSKELGRPKLKETHMPMTDGKMADVAKELSARIDQEKKILVKTPEKELPPNRRKR